MKVRFWGVRGSFATPGPAFLKYGGNTTSVEVRSEAGARLLIDLGTGATEFAKDLMASNFFGKGGELQVLLSHTHIDHIQGLPFFTPFFVKGNRIRIFGSGSGGMALEQIFQTQLNPHYSPLNGLENLAAGIEIEPVEPGVPLNIDGFSVSAVSLPHGGMSVLGYRIEADGESLVFMSDVEYGPEGMQSEVLGFGRGADLLIHDAMFLDDEYELRRGWGHSSVGGAIEAAEALEAKRLALFHHSPDSTDDMIDQIVSNAELSTKVPLFAAREGEFVPVGKV